MSLPNHFDLVAADGPARTGRLTTPHGVVRTPAFMPVGTAGAMKGMHWREVRDAGTDIVLGNTYHLMLRPGAERIAALGGLQTFTGWNGPMLTDSGGFQVMSLAQLRKVSESAVTFRSHIDGASLELSPERAIEVQRLLGSDIAMQLDECVRLPAERGDIERAMQLSLRWGERSKRAFESAPPGYMLFGIAQGGDVPELRRASARGMGVTAWRSRGSVRSTCATRATRTTHGRSTRKARGPPPALARAPTCIISSSQERRWERCCCRKSISRITST